MKSRSLLSALAVAFGLMFVTACTTSNVGAPTETTNRAFAAMVECDFEKAAKFCHGEMAEEARSVAKMLEQMDAEAKKGDQKAKIGLNEIVSGFRSMKVTFKNEKIEGNFAVLDVFITVTGANGPVQKSEKAYLQKIDGDWKLISANDYFKANPDKIKIAHPAKKAEPKKAEPKAAEPKKAEPKTAEPKKAEPKAAEPKAAK